MKHEFSLAHLTALSFTPPKLVDLAASAGYHYVGLRMTRVTPQEVLYPLASDKALMKETKERLAATGIRVLDVELCRMGPENEPESYLPVLEAAAELGAPHAIGQLPDPDRARATDRFGRLCDLAKPLGITISLEYPSWTETGNLAEAVRVLRATNRSNAGILIDMLHFARAGDKPDDLKKLPPSWFKFAHVCDAAKEVPTTVEGLIFTAREDRHFPGEGGIDVRGILACMPQGIPYALEIPTQLAKRIGEGEAARLALRAAERYLNTVEALA